MKFISKSNSYYFENNKYYKKEYFNNNKFDPNNKGRKDGLKILLLALKKLIIPILGFDIIVLTSISKFNLKFFINLIKTLLNINFTTMNAFLTQININNKFINLLIFLLIKLFTLILLPISPIIFSLFLIYVRIIKNENHIRYLACKTIDLTNIDKLTWYITFKKFNIKSPTVYGVIDKNNKLKLIDNSFNPNEKYIIKPVNGIQGRTVMFESYNNIQKNNIKFEEPMLIQKRVYDCKYGLNRARHFRVNSFYNKKTNESHLINFFIYNGKEGKLASNFAQGGSKIDCGDLSDCRILSKEEIEKLNKIKNQLLLLHKKLKNPLFGWDIILACDDAYVLEGNNCPGTSKMNNESIEKFKKFFNKNY